MARPEPPDDIASYLSTLFDSSEESRPSVSEENLTNLQSTLPTSLCSSAPPTVDMRPRSSAALIPDESVPHLHVSEQQPRTPPNAADMPGEFPSTPVSLPRPATFALPAIVKANLESTLQTPVSLQPAHRTDRPVTDTGHVTYGIRNSTRSGPHEGITCTARNSDLILSPTFSNGPDLFSSFSSIDGSFSEGPARSDAGLDDPTDKDNDEEMSNATPSPETSKAAKNHSNTIPIGFHISVNQETGSDTSQSPKTHNVITSVRPGVQVRRASSVCSPRSSRISCIQSGRALNGFHKDSAKSWLYNDYMSRTSPARDNLTCTPRKRGFEAFLESSMHKGPIHTPQSHSTHEQRCTSPSTPRQRDAGSRASHQKRDLHESMSTRSTSDCSMMDHASDASRASTLLEHFRHLIKTDPAVIAMAIDLAHELNQATTERASDTTIEHLHGLIDAFAAPRTHRQEGNSAKRRAARVNDRRPASDVFFSRILGFELHTVPHYTSFLRALIKHPTLECMFANYTHTEIQTVSGSSSKRLKTDAARLLKSAMSFFRMADVRDEQAGVVRILLCIFLFIVRYDSLSAWVDDVTGAWRMRPVGDRDADALWSKFTRGVPWGHGGVSSHDREEFCATVRTHVEHGSKLAFMARRTSLSVVVYLYTTGLVSFTNIDKGSKGREASGVSSKAIEHLNASGAVTRGFSEGLERALQLCLWEMAERVQGEQHRSLDSETWTRFPGFDG